MKRIQNTLETLLQNHYTIVVGNTRVKFIEYALAINTETKRLEVIVYDEGMRGNIVVTEFGTPTIQGYLCNYDVLYPFDVVKLEHLNNHLLSLINMEIDKDNWIKLMDKLVK